jgi:hypothetical protein
MMNDGGLGGAAVFFAVRSADRDVFGAIEPARARLAAQHLEIG